MKQTIFVILLLSVSQVGYSQDSISAFGSVVIFKPPDSTSWNLVQRGMDEETHKYVIMYKHNPINDAGGRSIEPVVAVLCEEISEPMEIIKYSLWKRQQVSFTVNGILSKYTQELSYWNAIGYEGEYSKDDIVHKILIGHFRHKRLGAQIICDSTEGVYDKVDRDMRAFLKSVSFTDEARPASGNGETLDLTTTHSAYIC